MMSVIIFVYFYCISIETFLVPDKISLTAFVDVSPEETQQKNPFESFKDDGEPSSAKEIRVPDEVSF